MSSIDRTLDALESLTNAASGLTPYARSQALVGVAQASATLALAEEQRTANLIAVAALADALERPYVGDVARDTLLAIIARRLDLTPED